MKWLNQAFIDLYNKIEAADLTETKLGFDEGHVTALPKNIDRLTALPPEIRKLTVLRDLNHRHNQIPQEAKEKIITLFADQTQAVRIRF